MALIHLAVRAFARKQQMHVLLYMHAADIQEVLVNQVRRSLDDAFPAPIDTEEPRRLDLGSLRETSYIPGSKTRTKIS